MAEEDGDFLEGGLLELRLVELDDSEGCAEHEDLAVKEEAVPDSAGDGDRQAFAVQGQKPFHKVHVWRYLELMKLVVQRRHVLREEHFEDFEVLLELCEIYTEEGVEVTAVQQIGEADEGGNGVHVEKKHRGEVRHPLDVSYIRPEKAVCLQ
eukprot:CAMPEP_0196668242 /NCGR_PEP_ID=MMETSP1086-20130531/65515_1 /TAXON_ID=77921 /ORGANISM="Cyanoptyche  gloeocystis , Strain SAG4.97" /LENGTH=151 /DNA_ID=CAMNT_0042005633 /DNA_START=556 /DNA_END=1008 /DNA_ORIENTATION=+